ncbi:MAG: 3-keto-5-aminohexanoate cleavage protein [Spirochaetales bacterium]|nr:3-keto-5-aminohexanoate cleavage protein [Spirochaetales bacterium]
MADFVSLSLAPQGGWGRGKGNPLQPKELAFEVAACAELGASIVHLHSRSITGALSADIRVFQESASRITGLTNICIEASSGGLSNLDDDERIRPASAEEATLASLNLGSLNFGEEVYQNSLQSIRYWCHQLNTWNVHPSLEIFDTGNIEIARYLIDRGLIVPPFNFSFIFNCKWGMIYSESLLKYLISRLPEESNWGVIFVGSKDFQQHLEALDLGAQIIRVGFEDSNVLNGREALRNCDLVAGLKREMEHNGFKLKSIEETRKMLLHNSE